MIINQGNLQTVYTGFKASFQKGFDGAPSQWIVVATEVPSTTSSEEYGWLGSFPGMREWIGDRIVNNLKEHGYTIRNKSFENTIAVPAPKIKDDEYGIYAPLFQEQGRMAANHPDELVFGLLKNGFSQLCYDGQYFFDTDHPVTDENGVETSVANTDGGSGNAWFLFDSKRSLKPILFQKREPYSFVAKNKPEDDNVFFRDEYLYGVNARCNVGFGFWQSCWGSKQTLDAAHYDAALAALIGMKGDRGRVLGVIPDTLLVGPANATAARTLVTAETLTGGASNPYKGTATVVVVPWLA